MTQIICCRYQIKVLELLIEKACEKQNIDWSRHINEVEECQFLEIHTPKGIDLSDSTEYASQAAIWGIEVSIVILPNSYSSFSCGSCMELWIP